MRLHARTQREQALEQVMELPQAKESRLTPWVSTLLSFLTLEKLCKSVSEFMRVYI